MARGSGGVKGGFKSLVTILILAGMVLGWARLNHIDSVESAYNYFHRASSKLDACMQANEKAPWTCYFGTITAGMDSGSKPSAPSTGGTGNNGGGTPAKPAPETVQVLEGQLNALPVGTDTSKKYNRKDFKHWSKQPSGCNTRQQAIIDQGQNVQKQGCKATAGTWLDAYSGETFTNPKKMDLDHVIPLGYAARHGAYNWDSTKREQFANDLTQLLMVSARENRSKSDKGPSEYMPPNKAFWCSYSTTWITTASKYGLSVTAQDKAALAQGLATCK